MKMLWITVRSNKLVDLSTASWLGREYEPRLVLALSCPQGRVVVVYQALDEGLDLVRLDQGHDTSSPSGPGQPGTKRAVFPTQVYKLVQLRV